MQGLARACASCWVAARERACQAVAVRPAAGFVSPRQQDPLSCCPLPSRAVFNLKFTAKQLGRAAVKSEKDEKAEKLKVKKAIEKGNMEGAKIYVGGAHGPGHS